jgi:hypothetical protein
MSKSDRTANEIFNLPGGVPFRVNRRVNTKSARPGINARLPPYMRVHISDEGKPMLELFDARGKSVQVPLKSLRSLELAFAGLPKRKKSRSAQKPGALQ